MNKELSSAFIAIPAKSPGNGLNTVIIFFFSNKLDKMIGSITPYPLLSRKAKAFSSISLLIKELSFII
jgi:hypothetical protein